MWVKFLIFYNFNKGWIIQQGHKWYNFPGLCVLSRFTSDYEVSGVFLVFLLLSSLITYIFLIHLKYTPNKYFMSIQVFLVYAACLLMLIFCCPLWIKCILAYWKFCEPGTFFTVSFDYFPQTYIRIIAGSICFFVSYKFIKKKHLAKGLPNSSYMREPLKP
jgi:hypothetical protein